MGIEEGSISQSYVPESRSEALQTDLSEQLKQTDAVLILAGGFPERAIAKKRWYDLDTKKYIDEDPTEELVFSLLNKWAQQTSTGDKKVRIRAEKARESLEGRFINVTQLDQDGNPIVKETINRLSGVNPAEGKFPEKGPTFVKSRPYIARTIVSIAPQAEILVLSDTKPTKPEDEGNAKKRGESDLIVHELSKGSEDKKTNLII